MTIRSSMMAPGIASVVSMLSVATASADGWFVLGEKAITSNSTTAEIKAEQGKVWTEYIKKTKISVEGADVEIQNVLLNWNFAEDDTLTNVGVLKAGGESAPKDAPMREANLMSVTVNYKLLNGATQANLKVWGYD